MRPDIVQIGYQVLYSSVDETTGRVYLQLGDVRGQKASDRCALMQQCGWASIPPNPNRATQEAAWAATIRGGHGDTVIATQDLRGLALYANLKPGEFCAYAAGPDGTAQGRIIGKADGSVTTFSTANNTSDGASVYLQVAPDGLRFVSPYGTLTLDATGFHVVHSSGASLNLGGIAGLPAPLDKIGSYVRMEAGTIHGSCSNASFGASPAPTPLADATQVATAIAALQAQVEAIAKAVAALQSNPSNSGASALTLAMSTAVAGAGPTVTHAIAAFPTTTSS